MTEALSKDELESRMTELQARMIAALTPYEVESAVCLWLDTLRSIDELINLFTFDWDDESFERQLAAFPVLQPAQHAAELQAIRRRLAGRFSTQFANRISNLLIQGSAIAVAFADHGVVEAASGFQSLGSMIGYLQSRRRHFVGLLHLMATACHGSKRVTQLDTLNIFLPIVELSALPMMGAQYSLMVKLAQERLGIPEDDGAELAMLDGLFLEPERVSIVEMPWSEEGRQMLEAKEVLLPDRLFSAAELRNDILLIEAAYAEFDLRGTDFATAASLVRRLSRDYIDRDYWIQISPAELTRLTTQVGASPALVSALTCHDDSYMKSQSAERLHELSMTTRIVGLP